VLWRATQKEVPLVAVDPGQGIIDTVKLWEFNLVRRLLPVGADVGVAISAATPRVVLLAAIAPILRQRDRVVTAVRRGRGHVGRERGAHTPSPVP
jgi:hypothetical protein